ncbi:hypothetical protein EVAR_23327_1 [Eumeta japonica]|uniref:Uncharacterized protein n=1 Tax=Eumeta variegata TaxID=151549 RepID=A0A4C1XX73_EUMVA|nr:hypothetical protein EVAR_23327_1 [Eumeta japonica]
MKALVDRRRLVEWPRRRTRVDRVFTFFNIGVKVRSPLRRVGRGPAAGRAADTGPVLENTVDFDTQSIACDVVFRTSRAVRLSAAPHPPLALARRAKASPTVFFATTQEVDKEFIP